MRGSVTGNCGCERRASLAHYCLHLIALVDWNTILLDSVLLILHFLRLPVSAVGRLFSTKALPYCS